MHSVAFLTVCALLCTLLPTSVHGAKLPVIPGTQYVGCGVNLTNMQLGLGNVIDLTTFSYNITWQNGITGQVYRVPDMMFAQTNSSSQVAISTSTFSGVSDFQIWALHHYKWRSGLFGMVSHSKTTYDYLQRRYTLDETMSLNTLDMQFLTLTVPDFPPPNLSPVFQQAIEMLPSTCCDNPSDYDMYMQFFASFGHGWMSDANLGGRLWYEQWMPICFLTEKSVHWVTEQSSWSFLHIIGNGKGSVTNDTRINPAFEACISSQYIFQGGSQMLQNPSYYDFWKPTIFDKPVPLTFSVLPYSSLISDPAKAAAMDAATAKFLGNSQTRMEAYQASLAQNDPHLHPQCCNELRKSMGL